MKISIRNLGPVKNAEIDINDLTIIAGGNNTGKTYITYAIYGLLREWRYSTSGDIDEVKSFAEELIEKGIVAIPADRLNDKRAEIINRISESFSADIYNIFGTGKARFPDTKIAISIEEQDKATFTNEVSRRFSLGKSIFIEAKHGKEGEMILTLIADDKKNLPSSHSLTLYIDNILRRFLLESFFPYPFILSAERQAISLFYKSLDIKRNIYIEQCREMFGDVEREDFDDLDSMEKHSSRYALPIKDSIFFTRDIDNVKSEESSLFLRKKISNKIEEMMGGYFEQIDKEVHFISKAGKGEKKFDIPLYLASSSARGLSDIYFFLKHRAKDGDIIMIDEPESHLHPANQILMARLLAVCVNSGLKIFISTHSDYIIKEFNNLIMLSNDFEGKEDFLKNNPYGKDDFLKPESVSAYICKNGTLTPCEVDGKGMDISSFDDTIDNINAVADELDYLTGPIDED